MSTEIYYFSGTGNSLYAAKELQKRLPQSVLIPIASLLNQDVIETNGETVGIVFPIYMSAAPLTVRRFISKLNLKSAKYIFTVATRIGTTHSAFTSIDKILKKKGRMIDSYFSLNMPSNDPKFNYKSPTEKEIKELEDVVHQRLDSIEKIIINKEKSRENDIYCTSSFPFVNALSSLMGFLQGIEYNLYSDSKCIGCGTCEKVCLSKKIKMIDKKPLWQKDIKCYKCSACLNFCPAQSVQIKSYTEKNGRYSHPYATVDDIAQQKK